MKGGYYFPKGRKTGRVWVSFKGKKIFVNKYLDGTPLYHEEQCKRVLEKIRGEIDQKSFEPSHWGKDKFILFERAWEIYMNQAKVGIGRMEARDMVYRKYLEPYFKGKSIRDIQTIHIQDWYNNLSKIIHSEGYLRLIVVTLKAFFHFHSDSIIKIPKFPVLKSSPKEIIWLDSQQQEMVHEFIPIQHKPIFRFLMITGCRPSEACNLKNQDFDWGKKIFSFKSTKTRQSIPLPITPIIEEIVKDKGVIKSIEYVFCTIRGRKYRRQTLYGIWKKANIRANKKYRVPIVSNYMGNRHSFASQRANEGHDLKFISMAMGHSSVTTTEKYYARYKTDKLKNVLSGHKLDTSITK